MNDLISRRAALDAMCDACETVQAVCAHFPCGRYLAIERTPSEQPEQKHGRVFKGIVVEYPSYSAYPEYKGKPYFSIKYTENGEGFIGYGTYKPEVLSEYLKEYFMPSAQPERKKGKWERHYSRPNVYADLFWHCSECGYKNSNQYAYLYHRFCPNCGADMRETINYQLTCN